MERQLDLGFPGCLATDFPSELPEAISVTDDIIAAIHGADARALARRSPGLLGFDWPNYLRCSLARLVHAAASLRRRGLTSGRVLDFGAYFGNFSLLFARLGFQVDAVDAFREYAPALDASQAVLRAAGVRILDFADTGRHLQQIRDAEYDVVICTGVIEHIPHTPRLLLESLDRVLRTGGTLLIDTPNLAHIYNRQKFARGESVHAELPAQYLSDPPFEGHHREYTLPELVWMLRRLGHIDVQVESFNYSVYGQSSIRGRDVINHWAMVQDPTMREYLLGASTKPAPSQRRIPFDGVADVAWRSAFYDPELYWQRALPAGALPQQVSSEGEEMVITLGREVNRRDVMLREQHDAMQAEIDKRDGMLAALQAERNDAVTLRDGIINELRSELDVMTRGWRRLLKPRAKKSNA